MGKVLTVSQAAFSKPLPSLTTNDLTKRAHINEAILSEPFHKALVPVRALQVREEKLCRNLCVLVGLLWQGAMSQRKATYGSREGGCPIAVQTDTDKTTTNPSL